MKRHWQPVWFSLLGMALTMSCGGGAATKAAEDLLVQTRQKVDQFEAQIAAEDTGALEVLETCREKLVLANRSLVEGDAEKASEILGEIKSELLVFQGAGRDKKGRTLEVHGLVRYMGSNGEWQRLERKQNLAAVREIQVSGRSGLTMNLFKSVEIFLPAQTEISILAYDPDAKRLVCKINRGELILEKKPSDAIIEVGMNDYQFVFDDRAYSEFRYMPLVNSVYVAVFDGKLRWSGEGGSGTLIKYDGFQWRNNDFKVIQVPTVPEIDEPGHESKVGINPDTGEAEVRFRWHSSIFIANYQLQISDSPTFITRVYDNLRLDRTQAEVSLGKGTYFWRVRSISGEGVPGAFTKTMELHVGAFREQIGSASSSASKSAEVEGPKVSDLDYNLIGTTVIVSGKTALGAKVNVNGIAAVLTDEGNFQAIVNFDRAGEHTVRILAMDPTTGGETVLEKKIKIAF